MSSSSIAVQKCRDKHKAKLIEAFGGACGICGYDKSCGLAWHHVDTKSGSISRLLQFSWDRLIEEASKCVMLCHNCHSEVHRGIADASKARRIGPIPDRKQKIVKSSTCVACGHKFFGRVSKYCNLKCARLGSRKISDEAISQAMLIYGSYNAAAVNLGVSYNAIKKRCFKLGITSSKSCKNIRDSQVKFQCSCSVKNTESLISSSAPD